MGSSCSENQNIQLIYFVRSCLTDLILMHFRTRLTVPQRQLRVLSCVHLGEKGRKKPQQINLSQLSRRRKLPLQLWLEQKSVKFQATPLASCRNCAQPRNGLCPPTSNCKSGVLVMNAVSSSRFPLMTAQPLSLKSVLELPRSW